MKNMAWLNFSASYLNYIIWDKAYWVVMCLPTDLDDLLVHGWDEPVLGQYLDRVGR
jgi:hypothetical protein